MVATVIIGVAAILIIIGLVGWTVVNQKRMEAKEAKRVEEYERLDKEIKLRIEERAALMEQIREVQEEMNNVVKERDDAVKEWENVVEKYGAKEELEGRIKKLSGIEDNLHNEMAHQTAIKKDVDNEVNQMQEKLIGMIERLHESEKLVEENAAKKKDIENDIALLKKVLLEIEKYDNEVMVHHKQCVIRAYGEKNGKFGMLEFTEREIAELEQLNKVLVMLSNPVPLYKVIYEMYYRDKMKSIIVNLGLEGKRCGIYRLYRVEEDGSETSYVGQSVDIGNRWYQHLKRFVGSEPATGIKLYKSGINVGELRWELIEEVDASKLNEREKYWIEFYNCVGGWNSRL